MSPCWCWQLPGLSLLLETGLRGNCQRTEGWYSLHLSQRNESLRTRGHCLENTHSGPGTPRGASSEHPSRLRITSAGQHSGLRLRLHTGFPHREEQAFMFCRAGLMGWPGGGRTCSECSPSSLLTYPVGIALQSEGRSLGLFLQGAPVVGPFVQVITILCVGIPEGLPGSREGIYGQELPQFLHTKLIRLSILKPFLSTLRKPGQPHKFSCLLEKLKGSGVLREEWG